jgi:hypothetical protein
MSEPPEANSPIATGDVAVKDIGSVVDFILRRRNISRLNLLGWSWGDDADGDLYDSKSREG